MIYENDPSLDWEREDDQKRWEKMQRMEQRLALWKEHREAFQDANYLAIYKKLNTI